MRKDYAQGNWYVVSPNLKLVGTDIIIKISTLPAESHPTGYIVSNVDDLLELFNADFGILVIGEGAKIFGPNNHGQELLLIAEYLRLKQFTSVILFLIIEIN